MRQETLSRDGAVVGFDNAICSVTFKNNIMCDAHFMIYDRGQIYVTLLIPDGVNLATGGPEEFVGAVTGGTDEYAGARGTAHFHIFKDRRFNEDITFELIGVGAL
jgi:hypothetical protein